jgi:hypothetical protein
MDIRPAIATTRKSAFMVMAPWPAGSQSKFLIPIKHPCLIKKLFVGHTLIVELHTLGIVEKKEQK